MVMSPITLKEKDANTVIHQFIFPFSIRKSAYKEMRADLEQRGFVPFDIRNTKLENAFYGEKHQISHRELEHLFLPFTNQFLFPSNTQDALSFQRYSKIVNEDYEMLTPNSILPFHIHSVDIVLCPYEIGMFTIRTALTRPCTFSESLEFARRFRALENLEPKDELSYIKSKNAIYDEILSFFNEELLPDLLHWLDDEDKEDTSFERLPFFINERMFTISLYGLPADETITNADLFRAVRLHGFNAQNEDYIGSSSPEYIAEFVKRRIYERWAPNTYYVADEHVLSCMTNASHGRTITLANEMYGRYYYIFLLNLFHKIVLLKLSNHYGRLQLDSNRDRVEELIRGITLFSSRFYYREMVSESQLQDVFQLLRRMHGNDELLKDVKQTLSALYDYQSNTTSKRSDYMLRILTIFTVISGIYGMNQVIDDLKYPIHWKRAEHYSVFEYLALVVTFIGIAVSLVLTITTLWGIVKTSIRRRRNP